MVDYSNQEFWAMLYKEIEDLRRRINGVYGLLKKLETKFLQQTTG